MSKFFARFFSLLMVLLMAGLFTNGANADLPQTFSSGDFTCYIVDGRLCGARYQGTSDDVVIPRKINGYPIVSIGDGAFMEYGFIKSVTILNNTMSIGAYSFFNCAALTSVSIPETVKFIGERAFEGCENLTLIVVKNSYAAQYAEENGIPYTFAS